MFIYNVQPILDHQVKEKMNYSNELNKLTLWHHRLGHIELSAIEKKINRLKTAISLLTLDTRQHLVQCINCQFGKQTRGFFMKFEELPNNMNDLVSSDVCGPFETSIGGYWYFITWIDHSSCYVRLIFSRIKNVPQSQIHSRHTIHG